MNPIPGDENTQFQLPILAANMVLQRYDEARNIITQLRDKGVEQNILREAIIQTYLFDGYPTALEGLFILAEVLGAENNPPSAESLDNLTLKRWVEQGESTCRIIYRQNYERLLSNVKRLSPDFANWMVVEGYGKTLSRGALNLEVRELINIAILAVKDYPRQLHSHLKGAMNAGTGRNEIKLLLEMLKPLAPSQISKAEILFQQILDSGQPL